ncbi:FAD:protein FMN transferase [Kordiimonas lacus]|uniref:FAD:protein FMN transferase n=1 Tax=Kordiimonas lacus TaxID=637679 RepID=A0A1G6XRP2_9PROT|nr:FAD:protein FMN transferase [Kordiimonas lacus]SDD80874.1 ApbE family protein [Kordiimonas lacus]
MIMERGFEKQMRRCTCHKESRARPALGTVMKLTTVGLRQACAARAQALAFECADALEARLAVTTGDSELMRLWDAPVAKPIAVSDAVWQLMRVANELAFRTDGIFDAAASGSDGQAHWTDIDLSKRGYVRFRRKMRFDPTGLVKGFAADIAVQAMSEQGARRGLVDVGGVMRAFGPQEWRVQYHLANSKHPLPVALTDGALAGGGSNSGRLFDPVTGVMHAGQEWRDLRLVVRARTAAVADGLTKVAMLAPGRAATLLPRLGASVAMLTNEGAHALEYAS